MRKLVNINKDSLIIAKNFSFLTILRGFNVGAKFILVAYLIRVLGNTNYGVVTWVDAIIQYFLMFINFGFNIYAAKYVVNHRAKIAELNEIVSSIFIIKFSLFLISFFILSILSIFPIFNQYHELLFLMLLMGVGDVFFPIWYFQGIEKLKTATLITVFSRLILILSTLFLVSEETDIKKYIIVLVVSNIIMGGLGYYVLIKKHNYKFKTVKFNKLLKMIKEAYMFFLGVFMSLTFNLATIFLIGVFFTMNYVSGFDVSLKIVLVCIIPFDMLQQAIYPTITRTQNKKLLKKIILGSAFLGVFFSFFLYFFAEQLLFLFGGEEMIMYVEVLRMLALIPTFVAVTFMLGTCTLVAFGYQKEFNKSLIISSIIYILTLTVLYFFNSLTFWSFIYLRVISDFILMLIRIYYVYRNNIF